MIGRPKKAPAAVSKAPADAAPASSRRKAKAPRPAKPRGRRWLPFPSRSERPAGGDSYGQTALLAGYHRNSRARLVEIVLYAVLAVGAVVWGFAFGFAAPFKVMPLVAPLAALALLIVWLLPKGDYAPVGAIEPLYLAFFAALVLWPNYIALALPHLPWITLLRLTGVPLILVLLISLRVSASFRETMKDFVVSDKVFFQMLAAFLVIQTFSIVFSSKPTSSINKWMVFHFNCTSILFASLFLFLQKGFADRWVKMLFAMNFTVMAFGLWENRLAELPWAQHIPSMLKIDGELMDSMLAGVTRAAVGAHRVTSVQTTPLGLAELLGMGAPFAVHFVVTSRSIVGRIIGAAYMPMAFYLIVLADSRLGMVALLTSVLFYTAFWSVLEWRRNRGSLLAPALILAYPAIFAATVTATFVVGSLKTKVWGGGAQQASSNARDAQWTMATPKILTHPFGHGIGRAAAEVGFVNPAGRGTLDSFYITILMEYGPLGFALFYGMFLWAVWRSSKAVFLSRPQGDLALLLPLAVGLLNFVIVKSVFSQDANHPLAFMMLGGTMALSYRALKSVAPPPIAESTTARYVSTTPARV